MNYPENISAEEIEALELADFQGPITVVESLDHDFAAAVEYLSKASVIGFDTETKPCFTSNAPRNKVALLQLADDKQAFIFRVNKLGLPKPLVSLLSNPSVTKVGAAVKEDLRGLFEYRKFVPKGFVDLQSFVEQYGIGVKSVKKMAAIILGVKVSKSQQLSNWEAPCLSGPQLKYAAIDAVVCHNMYVTLVSESGKDPKAVLPAIPKVYLKKGRTESIKRFHPWIFSGAVAQIEGNPNEGEVVEVYSSMGEFLALGHFQQGSISVRILSFDAKYRPEEGMMPLSFWKERLTKAMQMRKLLGIVSGRKSDKTDCFRLVHGEGDSLPGLIIDIYSDAAVLQAHSVGMFLSKDLIAKSLVELFPNIKTVYDKSEGTAPYKAGLPLSDGYIIGDGDGENSRIVYENGYKFKVDWKEGQKTGFFLDQRDNRALVGKYAKGKRVLNLFCYTGGFSIYALGAGAKSVVSVDSSAKAIEMVDENVAINFSDKNVDHTSVCTDAIDYVKSLPAGEFDLMVVDPPAFAKHRESLDNALRAYKRLNAAAIEKVAPGGLIFTYSCSQVVDKVAFAQAVFSAAAQTGRNVKILRRLTQPADHPVNIYHPEGEYLKGLLIYVE